jgi:uroporphyrinogen-III decarboxylase
VNARERFLKIMGLQPVDRLPIVIVEAIEGPTLRRWHHQGLPVGANVQGYLGMDRLEFVSVDQHMLPRFQVQILEETDEYRTEVNELGTKTRYSRKDPDYLYGFLEHPVKDRRDWEALRERFDPKDPRRLLKDWGPEKVRYCQEVDHPIGMVFHPFFFRRALYLMGLQSFMLALHDDPDLIHDMFEQTAQFCLEACRPVFAAVPIDFVAIAEDMAFRTGTQVSPRMYREFWYPHQRQVTDWLRDRRMPVIGLWNSGGITPLLPAMIELGYNMTFPVEAQAGLIVVDMAQEFGHSLRYMGSTGIQALIRGDEAIRQEVAAKVLPLLESGGYLPAPEDQIPPDAPLAHFEYYVELLRKANAGEVI